MTADLCLLCGAYEHGPRPLQRLGEVMMNKVMQYIHNGLGWYVCRLHPGREFPEYAACGDCADLTNQRPQWNLYNVEGGINGTYGEQIVVQRSALQIGSGNVTIHIDDAGETVGADLTPANAAKLIEAIATCLQSVEPMRDPVPRAWDSPHTPSLHEEDSCGTCHPPSETP